jgi:hypothetical protein
MQHLQPIIVVANPLNIVKPQPIGSCMICLSEQPVPVSKKFRCGCVGIFHMACLRTWDSKNSTRQCPLCRSNLEAAAEPPPPPPPPHTIPMPSTILVPHQHYPQHISFWEMNTLQKCVCLVISGVALLLPITILYLLFKNK